jgi:phosphatidylserine decarboxylase
MAESQNMLATVLVPIHRDGWKFIAIFAVVALILGQVHGLLGWIGAIATAWCVYFFRDPPRVTPARAGLVLSPADGVVQMIRPAPPPPELDMGEAALTRVSIFMNVFNVHVNRMPSDGVVTALAYRPGKFFNASLDKASEFNERQGIRLRLNDGRDLVLVQIAGLVARRIRCEAVRDQVVKAGERFGLIRFGSRVDVYLPDGVSPLVVEGQTAVAGETVIADLQSSEVSRTGEVR